MKVLVFIPTAGLPGAQPEIELLELSGISLVGHAVRLGRSFLQVGGLEGTVLLEAYSDVLRDEGKRWGAVAYTTPTGCGAESVMPLVDRVLHAIDAVNKARGEHDTVVVVDPRSPLCKASDVDACYRTFSRFGGSVLAVAHSEFTAEQAMCAEADGTILLTFAADPGKDGKARPNAMWHPSRAIYVASTKFLTCHRAFNVPGSTRGVSISREREFVVKRTEDLKIAQAILDSLPSHPVRIGNHFLGDGRPTFIIAEAGVNHNGDTELAHRLVDVAADAGATAVKFQTFDPARLVSPKAAMAAYQVENTGRERTQAEMLADLVLPPSVHRELLAHATDRQVMFLSSPFDEESADFLEELGVPAFKIASGEITNHPLLAHIARKGRPMIVSTGMANLREIDSALDVIERARPVDVVLLQCTTSYPAKIGDANLLAMSTLRGAFGLPVGYSDHTEGLVASLAAVAMGARVVEKHFTLDRSLPGPDHKASLTPEELGDLVSGIRAVEAARGDGVKEPRPVELPLIVAARKSLHAARDLPEGHVLCATDLIALRPGDGISPTRLDHLLGRTLARPVRGGDQLAENELV